MVLVPCVERSPDYERCPRLYFSFVPFDPPPAFFPLTVTPKTRVHTLRLGALACRSSFSEPAPALAFNVEVLALFIQLPPSPLPPLPPFSPKRGAVPDPLLSFVGSARPLSSRFSTASDVFAFLYFFYFLSFFDETDVLSLPRRPTIPSRPYPFFPRKPSRLLFSRLMGRIIRPLLISIFKCTCTLPSRPLSFFAVVKSIE